MHEETKGTYLEAIEDFEIMAGAKTGPHHHNTHEYYFVLDGESVAD